MAHFSGRVLLHFPLSLDFLYRQLIIRKEDVCVRVERSFLSVFFSAAYTARKLALEGVTQWDARMQTGSSSATAAIIVQPFSEYEMNWSSFLFIRTFPSKSKLTLMMYMPPVWPRLIDSRDLTELVVTGGLADDDSPGLGHNH